MLSLLPLALVGLVFPICALAALVIAVRARREARLLSARLALVEAGLAPGPAAPVDVPGPAVQEEIPPEVAETPTAPPPEKAEDLPGDAAPLGPADLGKGELAAAAGIAGTRTAPVDLEGNLGGRWAVWVGGVALALGGVFLVRYSIEQGLLGPQARVALGALFAALLLSAGEWMRRREVPLPNVVVPAAYVPGVLTAAGTVTAFTTAFAAHALYGLMGPAAAFVVLGFVALAALVLAALHGPILAALGLVAALATPLLVTSDDPQPWAVVVYVAFVGFAAYAVARLRRWRWLAVGAAVGAIGWALLLPASRGGTPPAMAHALLQVVLAGVFLVIEPNRGRADDDAAIDRLASGTLLAFAIVTVLIAGLPQAGDARPAFSGAMALVLLGLGLRFSSAAPGVAAAALAMLGTLLLWPVAREAAAEPLLLYPDVFGREPMPSAVATFLAFGAWLSAAICAGGILAAVRRPAASVPVAAWLVGAATAAPLLALVLAYWRVAYFDHSFPFGLVAGGLACAFALAAGRIPRQQAAESDALRLALGATVTAAFAALSVGLTFVLERGMLTVALALAALAAAFVANRLRLPDLRIVVGALGLAVAGRLIYDPAIVGGDLGRTPILNWLLPGYGVPALAFLLAARQLEFAGRDPLGRFAETLAIVFAALLVFFETRHWLQGGDPLAPVSSHLEMGLLATEGLAFSLLMVRAQAKRPDALYAIGSLVFGALTLAVAAAGLGIVYNPLWSDEAVVGGPVLNSLVAAYLLPAVLAGLLAWAASRVRPRWYVLAAGALALTLHLLYAVTATRRLFQGPAIQAWRATSDGELWTYSLVLLTIGIALLAIGIWRGRRSWRLLSAAYITAAVVKVFIVDLASLTGVIRALSFIALGLVLVGIGLAYQRLLRTPPRGLPP